MSGADAERAYTERLPVIARLANGDKWLSAPSGFIRRRTDSGLSKFFCEFEDKGKNSVMVIEAERLKFAEKAVT